MIRTRRGYKHRVDPAAFGRQFGQTLQAIMNGIARCGFVVVVALFGLAAFPVGASDPFNQSTTPANLRPQTTFERFLPLAVAGDSSIQHLLGYMYFYGEGVEANFEESKRWFELAAQEGDARAQRNLGLF